MLNLLHTHFTLSNHHNIHISPFNSVENMICKFLFTLSKKKNEEKNLLTLSKSKKRVIEWKKRKKNILNARYTIFFFSIFKVIRKRRKRRVEKYWNCVKFFFSFFLYLHFNFTGVESERREKKNPFRIWKWVKAMRIYTRRMDGVGENPHKQFFSSTKREKLYPEKKGKKKFQSVRDTRIGGLHMNLTYQEIKCKSKKIRRRKKYNIKSNIINFIFENT